MLRSAALAAALAFMCPVIPPAVQERLEAGDRFRDFERVWEARRDSLTPAARAEVIRRMGEAMSAMMAGNHGAVIEALVGARAAAEGGWDDAMRARHLCWLSAYPRVVPLGSAALLNVRLSAVGTAPDPAPEVTFVVPDTKSRAKAALGEAATLEDFADAEGRYEVVSFVGGKQAAPKAEIWVVRNLTSRLAALRTAIPAEPADAVQASLRWRLTVLEDAAGGKPLESVPDAVAELDALETDTELWKDGKNPFAKRKGDLRRAWLTENRLWPARVFVPPAYDASKKWPLLVTLHGFGASENAWFDVLGAGKVRKLAAERGWIVLSPRTPALFGPEGGGARLAGLVKRAAAEYSIDPARIFIAGHSLGGSQALDAASAAPGLFRGVAALAPAGRPDAAGYAGALYLACGDADPSVKSSRAAAKALAGREGFRYDERAGVEHLLIVAETMSAMFEWMEALK